MTRVNLNNAAPAVTEFLSALAIAGEGVELELNGRVLCKVMPPSGVPIDEMKALVDERWQLIHAAQRRTKGVSHQVLEREISDAVEEVRSRRRP
jgi:hypothetical protein